MRDEPTLPCGVRKDNKEWNLGKEECQPWGRFGRTTRFASRPLPPRAAGERDSLARRRRRLPIRPLPPCVAGEPDSAACEQHSDLACFWKSWALESDSPAGRADRGLRDLRAAESSQGI